ncbi:hypothetical protein ACA910_015822 [Epithemia clementina (nom. ined.)]
MRRMKERGVSERKLTETNSPTPGIKGKKENNGDSRSEVGTAKEGKGKARLSPSPTVYDTVRVTSDVTTLPPSGKSTSISAKKSTKRPTSSRDHPISPSRAPAKFTDIFVSSTKAPNVINTMTTIPVSQEGQILSEAPSLVPTWKPSSSSDPSNVPQSKPTFQNNNQAQSEKDGMTEDIPSLSPTSLSGGNRTSRPTLTIPPSIRKSSRQSPQLFTSTPTRSESSSPSEENKSSMDVRILPFTIIYKLQQESSIADLYFSQASKATTTYLDIAMKSRTKRYIELQVTRTDNGVSPVTITFYLIMSFFDEDTIFFEVHRYIREAFSAPYVTDLTEALHSLPISNPFSRTESVEFLETTEPTEKTEPDQVMSADVMALVIAVAFVCFALCAALILLRWVKHRESQVYLTLAMEKGKDEDFNSRRERDELLSFREEIYRSQSDVMPASVIECQRNSFESAHTFEDGTLISGLT